MAFGHSRRRWFGTRSCKPIPRGLPSSVKQLRTPTARWLSLCSWHTIVGISDKCLAPDLANVVVMRRTHASLSRKAGIYPKLVADQLGWAGRQAGRLYHFGSGSALESVNLLEQSLASTAVN